MSTKYDAIVIGLGAMGSASVYQLAKRGLRVLGIDRFSPPHNLGSTHGAARIMRLAIGEGAHYTPLSKRSYQLFREIEAETRTNLLEVTGMLTLSSVDKTQVVPEGDFFDNTVLAARQYNVHHDVLDANQVRARFPQFKVRDDERGYFEYDAGYLRPEQCLKAQLSLAERNGANIHRDEKVIGLHESAHEVTVQTNLGEYCADQVVVSAGPWVNSMLPEPFKSVFDVHRLVQCWFDVADSYDQFKTGSFPIFFRQLPGFDRWIYGFPALDGPKGGLKLSASDHAASVEPENVVRAVSEREIDAIYDEYVSDCLHGVGSDAINSDVCLYTATPDGAFVIDRLPHRQRTIVCSPCSGHGFKHSAAIGESIAELVGDGKSRIDLSQFGLQRFAERAGSVG